MILGQHEPQHPWHSVLKLKVLVVEAAPRIVDVCAPGAVATYDIAALAHEAWNLGGESISNNE